MRDHRCDAYWKAQAWVPRLLLAPSAPPEDQVRKGADGQNPRQNEDDDERDALPGGVHDAGQGASDAGGRFPDNGN